MVSSERSSNVSSAHGVLQMNPDYSGLAFWCFIYYKFGIVLSYFTLQNPSCLDRLEVGGGITLFCLHQDQGLEVIKEFFM